MGTGHSEGWVAASSSRGEIGWREQTLLLVSTVRLVLVGLTWCECVVCGLFKKIQRLVRQMVWIV